MAIVWINPRVPSLGVDRERDFFLVFTSLIKYTKPTKEDSLVLVLDGQYSHTRNLEVISLAQENHADVICLQHHRRHKIQLWIKISWGPPKHSTAKKLEKRPVCTQDESSPSTNWRNIRKCIQAICNRRNSG